MLKGKRLLLRILLTLVLAAMIAVLLLLPGIVVPESPIIGPATAPLAVVVTLAVVFMVTDPILGSIFKWLQGLGFTNTTHRHRSWWHATANKARASTTAGLYRVTDYLHGAADAPAIRKTGLEVRRHAPHLARTAHSPGYG